MKTGIVFYVCMVIVSWRLCWGLGRVVMSAVSDVDCCRRCVIAKAPRSVPLVAGVLEGSPS